MKKMFAGGVKVIIAIMAACLVGSVMAESSYASYTGYMFSAESGDVKYWVGYSGEYEDYELTQIYGTKSDSYGDVSIP